MTRFAAILILGAMAATPALAEPTCLPVPDAIAMLPAPLPDRAVVRRIGRDSSTVIAAWLESEGVPGAAATDYVQVVGDRGIGLVPIRAGRVCDGTAVQLDQGKAQELAALVRRYHDMRGTSGEVDA
ncbi:hypothetical protein [uncultured Methylobacterium sp.]|uniref:hypothetical protein n=1 Tax=uncultured Methylobacterium sp. TaxID=157278 RepID=UPI0035CA1C2F